MAAPLPPDEKTRLEYLEALAVLDTAPEPVFDRLVKLAQHVTGAPIALVSLVAEDRQWFKARCGVGVDEAPRVHAICSHAILQDRVLVVPDAAEDERFTDDPVVHGERGVRFYAGAPLVTAAGNLGTLCVVDTKPRGLTSEQEATLQLLAEAVVDALEQRVEARRVERTLRWMRLAEGLTKIGHWRVMHDDGSLFWSPEIFEIHGLDPEQYTPTVDTAIAAYHPDDRERVVKLLSKAMDSSEPFAFELRLFRSDGAIRWVRSRARPELDPLTGELVSIFGVFQDITEQRLMQSELVHSERLDSLALMAATMAHEINNPLTSMQLNAEVIARLATEAPPDLERIETMAVDLLDGVARIRKITQELRAITRPARQELEPVGLQRAVDAALRLSKLRLEGIEVSVALMEPVPQIQANEPRLVQVLMNLLLNASHSFYGVPESQRQVLVRSGPVGVAHTFIEVEDSGIGISDEALARVFEPFYTTKSVELGTGLGLHVCREIVQSFGGTIELRSSLGMGTTVRIELATHQTSATQKPETSPRPLVTSRPDTRLLVIDDDAMVGRALARALRGYDVEVEQDPRAGLQRLLESGDRYAAILCDLAMPLLSGPALHAAAVAERPELDERFLFITGGTQSAEGSQFVERHRRRVHLKPLHFQSLVEAIDAIVRQRQSEPEATAVVDG